MAESHLIASHIARSSAICRRVLPTARGAAVTSVTSTCPLTMRRFTLCAIEVISFGNTGHPGLTELQVFDEVVRVIRSNVDLLCRGMSAGG